MMQRGTFKEDNGRPLLLVAVILEIHEPGFGRTVGKGRILQLVLSAGIAHRPIQGMVLQNELQHGLAALLDQIAVGGDHQTIRHGRGACRLRLGCAGDFKQAHAARACSESPGNRSRRER